MTRSNNGDNRREDEGTKRLVNGALKAGASTVTGVIGGVVGSVIGPDASLVGVMMGGALGNVAGEIINGLRDDVRDRMLSHLERRRVDTVVEWAQEKVRQRLEAGGEERRDGFFSAPNERERPAAAELVEGVLLRAKNEHQEKKLRFLGSLFANMCFRADVSPELGNSILRIAENLAYRQFCVLALAGRGEALPLSDFLALPHRDNAEFEALRQQMRFMQSELFDPRLDIEGGEHRFELTSLGRVAYELLDLHEVPDDDLQNVRALLVAFRESERRPGL